MCMDQNIEESRQYHYVAMGLYHHNTGRGSSSKASGPNRAYVTYGKLKTKVEITSSGDGNIIGVNSQGMPSTEFKLSKANVVALENLPNKDREAIIQLNDEVDSRFKLLLKDA